MDDYNPEDSSITVGKTEEDYLDDLVNNSNFAGYGED